VSTLLRPVCTFCRDVLPERSKVESSALNSAPVVERPLMRGVGPSIFSMMGYLPKNRSINLRVRQM